MGNRRMTPVPGRHFAFVTVTQVTKYHTLVMDGSELGVTARVSDLLSRADPALRAMTVDSTDVKVDVRPMRQHHLSDPRGRRVVVHEDPRDPRQFVWSTPDDHEAGYHSRPWPTMGQAWDDARRALGQGIDLSLQAEGYPGDGVPVEELPTAAHVLDYLDTFAGQENTAEEVRDFVQKAARFIHDRLPPEQWRAEPELDQFIDWVREQG